MTGIPVSRRSMLRGAVLLGVGAAAGGLEIVQAGGASAADNPGIASCATWGARAPRSLSVISSNPNKILVHHTASANSTDYSQAHAYQLARDIQSWHMDGNGWSDSGQHFTISRGGYIMEGRHHSLETLNAGHGMVVGAHCPGQNDQSIGIENEGTYTSVTPPAALYNKLVAMCAYICDQYGIAATRIYGHRDYVATECPGNVLYGMLPQLRLDVAAALNGGGDPPPTEWSTIVDNSTAGAFTASSTWGVSTYSTARYGPDYRFANPTTTSDPAWYTVNVPEAGTYRVDVWYAANAGYNNSTPYIVATSTGNQTVIVSQRSGGGAWKSIGNFSLAAGSQQLVGVDCKTTGTGYLIADAIRVTRV